MVRTTTRTHCFVIAAVTILAVSFAIAAPPGQRRAGSLDVEGFKAGGPKPPKHEISLEVQGFKKDIVNLEAPSGATLSIELSAYGELGIGTASMPPTFPGEGQTGWIVFTEPDGCYSWVYDATCPIDETYLEFTPDIDLPDKPDYSGNVDRRIGLTDFGGGGQPTVYVYNPNTGLNDYLGPVGANPGREPDDVASRCSSRWMYFAGACATDADCMAGMTCRPVPSSPDGYGYGADDDLPGLVILSDAGVGLVLDEYFNFPPGPRQARNLAGFLNTVSYQMNDAKLRTSVVAHMNIPSGLFAPAALHDNCVGVGCDCVGAGSPTVCTGTKSRVDGGPVLDNVDIDAILADKVVTVRIFVVNGTAPSVLADMNADGVVNSKDAELAGYRLLSDEEVVQFRIYRDPDYSYGGNYDFDGNGIIPPVLPATAGGLSKVPR